MKKASLVVSILATLLLGGQAPSPIQHDLDALTKRGFTYCTLNNDLIELTDPMSGEKHLKSLRQPSEATIRAWAAQRRIPILEIDPNTIDTSRFSGWYSYWGQLPLSNGFGHPLVLGDLDGNGCTEVYGTYRIGSLLQTRIYQIDSVGAYSFLLGYNDLLALPRVVTNVDKDSFKKFSSATAD